MDENNAADQQNVNAQVQGDPQDTPVAGDTPVPEAASAQEAISALGVTPTPEAAVKPVASPTQEAPAMSENTSPSPITESSSVPETTSTPKATPEQSPTAQVQSSPLEASPAEAVPSAEAPAVDTSLAAAPPAGSVRADVGKEKKEGKGRAAPEDTDQKESAGQPGRQPLGREPVDESEVPPGFKKGGIKKKREIIKADEKDESNTQKLSSLVVPFFAAGVLLLIVVFVFIPFGTEIIETREQSKALAQEIERNEKKIETLNGISLSELDSNLRTVTTVVKDDMDVSELAIEVERIALENSLSPSGLQMSDASDLVLEDSAVADRSWVPGYAIAISGPFSFYGEFGQITNFLDDLRKNSYTVLSHGAIYVSRMDESQMEAVGAKGGEQLWSVNLLISGYTARPAEIANVADLVSVSIDSDVLDEIYIRAGKKEAIDEGSGEETDSEGSSSSENSGSGEESGGESE